MKLIAYDFDGTLVDIKARQMELLDYICKSFRVEIDQDMVWKKKLQGANNVSALSDAGLDVKLISEIDKIWRDEIETQFWLSFDQKISRRWDEINIIKSLNYSIYLISARSQPKNLYQQLEMLNSVELFQEIICVPPTSKIEKKAYFLRELQIDLFIGDTEADFESAQLANVQFCGVSTGQRSKEYLDSIGVANIDGNVMDLIHF